MTLPTVLFVLCAAVLTSLLTLGSVDPAIAVGLQHEFVHTFWAYLEFAILAVAALTVFIGVRAARRWIRDRRIAEGVIGIILVVVVLGAAIPARQHFTDQYEHAADSLFAVARKNASNSEFGKAAASRKKELTEAVASDSAVIRRVRALPRYSSYDYEVRSKDKPDAILVSMAVEHGQPKLTINLPSDLVPSFDDVPGKRPT
jgi:hypothetical protein